MNTYEHTRVQIISDTEFKVSRIYLPAEEIFTIHINGNASIMKIFMMKENRDEYTRISNIIGNKNTLIHQDGTVTILPSRASILNELQHTNKLLVWALTFTAAPCRTEKAEDPSYKRTSRKSDINIFK